MNTQDDFTEKAVRRAHDLGITRTTIEMIETALTHAVEHLKAGDSMSARHSVTFALERAEHALRETESIFK